MDLKDKVYFSVAGETDSSAPKSIYSFAQIFFLSLGVTLLPLLIPRATAILANGFLLPGKGSGSDDVLGENPRAHENNVEVTNRGENSKLKYRKYHGPSSSQTKKTKIKTTINNQIKIKQNQRQV